MPLSTGQDSVRFGIVYLLARRISFKTQGDAFVQQEQFVKREMAKGRLCAQGTGIDNPDVCGMVLQLCDVDQIPLDIHNKELLVITRLKPASFSNWVTPFMDSPF